MTLTPSRFQRRRTKGWRAPQGTVYVGRGSHYGNPYRITRNGSLWTVYTQVEKTDKPTIIHTTGSEHEARQVAVDKFRAMLRTPGGAEQAEYLARRLHGCDLMCWCPLDQPCHADVLLRLANDTQEG